MTSKHQIQSAKGMINEARKVLRKHNFIKARKLAQYLKITAQRASDVLAALPEWSLYTKGYRGNVWAREGYPL